MIIVGLLAVFFGLLCVASKTLGDFLWVIFIGVCFIIALHTYKNDAFIKFDGERFVVDKGAVSQTLERK